MLVLRGIRLGARPPRLSFSASEQKSPRQRSLPMSKHIRRLGISCCVMIALLVTPALVPLAGQEKKPAKELKYTEVDLGGGVKMKLVSIAPGKFMMGSPADEKGRHGDEVQREVEMSKGFWMGVYEVTQAEYVKVIGKIRASAREIGFRWKGCPDKTPWSFASS